MTADSEIRDKLHDLEMQVQGLRKDQESSSRDVNRLCEKVEKYTEVTQSQISKMAEATQTQIGKMNDDIGNRPPDTPDAFAQIQSLNSFASRAKRYVSSAIGTLFTVVGAIVAAIFLKLWGK